ncbi:MAG: glycosyltransferase family 4 protein [Candidatus Falkowbacteria bacterium]
MKIYFIGQKGIPAKDGGVENYVDNLAVRLAKQGHNVFAYTHWNYSNRQQKKYKGVNLINLPSIPTKNLDTITNTILATLHVLFMKADIIHYHSIGPSSLLWIPKLFKRNTAVVATFQSQCYLHQKWGSFARAYLKLGEYILCRFTDTVIVPSRLLQQYAKKMYQRDTNYIPNGVSLPNKQEANLIARWDLKKKNYILAVSRLIKHKGLHYLIEVYQKLQTDQKLVIVGEGAFTDDYVKELHQLAGNNKNIIFTGSQNGKALAQLYANAYAFVQPSESEGLSIALLEAMSYNLPIIASDITANKEAVGNTAFLFKNKQVNDLIKQLRYALKHKKQAQALGKESGKRVEELYDWDVLVNEVVETYKQAYFATQSKFFSHSLSVK